LACAEKTACLAVPDCLTPCSSIIDEHGGITSESSNLFGMAAECLRAASCPCMGMNSSSSCQCDGDATVTCADGTTKPCAPYRCNVRGECVSHCVSDGDCAFGFSCFTDGTCR
jgi:hypothetical protein